MAALILFAAIVTMFLMGIAMQGEFFSTNTESYLQTLGYFGELCVGLAMPAVRFFGYAGGNPLFVSADFGTAYLVAAGMLNTLSILDTYDIAMGRKTLKAVGENSNTTTEIENLNRKSRRASNIRV